jgi:hypothetical protein
LALSRNVRDVVAIASTPWPETKPGPGILNVNVLTDKSLIQIVPDEESE